MALEGAVAGIAKIATTAAPIAVESVAKAAPAATEAIAQTAVEGAAEVSKTAIETGAEALSDAAIKTAEAQASALSEGIANSAESAMDVGGADAALSSIRTANVTNEIPTSSGIVAVENNTDPSIDSSTPAESPIQSAEPLSNLTDSGMDQRAINAANVRIDQLKAEGQDVNLEERHRIYNEELQRINGTDAGSESASVDGVGVAEADSSVTQPEQIMVQADSGISEETRNDPDFQQKLEEERAIAQETGEPVGESELSQRALDKFNQDKQVEQSQLTPEQQKINQLEQKLNGLVAENAELKANMAQISAALTEMKDVLDTIVKEMAEKEQDPKKKESLLMLLAKISAIVVLGVAVEGGKTVAPPLSTPGR